MVFLKLDSFPFRIYDESRFAVNAYEMNKSGNYLVPTMNGEVDEYNSKPPLTLWFQVLSISILGFNELAIRLPSALAAALTILFLFRFLKKNTSIELASLSVLILLTTQGFVTFHTARTGDSDALLTLFTTLSLFSFINWIQTEKQRDIYLTFLFISIAFLAKSFAAFLFLPGMFITVFMMKNLSFIKTQLKSILGALLLLLLLIGVFLIAREIKTPGYIKTILLSDADKLLSAKDDHKEPWYYYIYEFTNYRFTFWFVLSVLGCSIIAFYRKCDIRKVAFPLFVLTLSYLLIISFSPTKVKWYDMPVLPFLAVMAAVPIYIIAKYETGIKPYQKIVICMMIFAIPLKQRFGQSQANSYNLFEYTNEMSDRYLFNLLKDGKPDNITVYSTGYDGALLCYTITVYKLAQNC